MSSTDQDTRERFPKEIEHHKLHVFRDDGVYRHIRLHRPGAGGCMHFDIITWPGYLCYTGDMGTFVFTRIEDMFEFFRRPSDARIDYRYWAEKCQGADKGDGVEEFDPDAFKRAIYERGVDLVRGSRDVLDKEARRDLWDDLRIEVLDRVDKFSNDVALYDRAYEWAYTANLGGGEVQRFHLELDEFPSSKRYTHRFLWCCHALVFGIAQYDAHKAAIAQPVPA